MTSTIDDEEPYTPDPLLFKENEPIKMPAMERGKFVDGTRVSFFIAVSRDAETKGMKVARRISIVE